MTLLVGLAAVVAIAAAVRSTWSPCGLSMLSTITPMAERSRGRRWGLTAGWFVLGAVLGGATLGLLAVLGAVVVDATGVGDSGVPLAAAAVVTFVTASMDLGIGTTMPHHRRQVDEVWLDQYRSWVYGLGFGWQIGSGLTTYIMTAAVYATVVLAALTASVPVAMGLAVLFGLVRGLAIGLGAGLTNPDRLRRFHQRFDELGPVVRAAVIGVQLLVATTAGAAVWGPLGGGCVAVAGVVAVLWSRRVVSRGSEPQAALVVEA